METKFTVDYFINKFNAISEDLWIQNVYSRGYRHCALGHCKLDVGIHSDEADALEDFLDNRTAEINDNRHEHYTQGHPKERILAALNDVKNGKFGR
jgi:hypothetical protein